jgi:riboflavin biosynthesis pyrimidine reductase
VHILTERVSNNYLAELRRDGISYFFAGRTKLNLAKALDIIGEEFKVKRLMLEGGGGINGSFLSAGLIDELSVLVLPLADGSAGMPTLFDRKTAPAVPLYLAASTQLDGGVVHLRYTLAKPT